MVNARQIACQDGLDENLLGLTCPVEVEIYSPVRQSSKRYCLSMLLEILDVKSDT